MSDTDLQPTTHVVPILRGQYSVMITPPWFVNGSEYVPKAATFKTLVNGQEAFGEVYRAIEAANKTVCIICWGFQPSMYFVRDGDPRHLMIGQLLERKARQGVMVRVLCWALTSDLAVNLTGVNESNTPGRQIIGIKDRPATSTDAQHAYDQAFYRIYDRKQSGAGEFRREFLISDDYPKDTLIFTSRSFSLMDEVLIGTMHYTDPGVSAATRAALTGVPTHHQKMVVTDHADPAAAVGFVMGHNMLDAYWDTPEHSCKRLAANRGRNGSWPRHDYSCRVTGPIVEDLFRNFASAWQRETGQALAVPDFSTYPLRDGDRAMCQTLRTQVQFGQRQDIMKGYLQAVSNATQCIHIENQYFRWPPLADKIKACAARQTAWGRTPEQHGSLYLFVITNTSDEGMGDGTVNTYRMLDSLGRADTIPEVARDQRLQDIDAQLDQNQKAMDPLLARRDALDSQARMLQGTGSADLNDRYAPINAQLAPLQARQQQLEDAKARLSPLSAKERAAGSTRTPEAIQQADIPGLKVQVATLVAPDTPDGQPWQEVYIHAKLMLVDDTFMTLGSANINTRSMQTDSELNIAHHRPEITGPLRARQWAKYTDGKVTQGMSLKDAYKAWTNLMRANLERRAQHQQPIAQLAEFLRSSGKITNKD